MENCSAGNVASTPKIAYFFHTLPHVNFDFDNVSSVFAPTRPDYQQALFLYALGPSFFGALVFLIFCVHFLASCCSCDKKHRPTFKCMAVLQCIVFSAAVISCGFVIAAFVFNDRVEQGVKGVMTAIDNVNSSLVEIQVKVNIIKDDMLDMDSVITDLKNWPGIPEPGMDLLQDVQRELSNIITSVVKIHKVTLPDISEQIHDFEYYRWWITFGTLFVSILTCLVTIYAVLRKNRSGFVVAILLEMFCLVLVWTGSSVDLAAVIGMSDLCVNPKGTVYFYKRKVITLKDTGIVEYYVECPADGENPRHENVQMAMQHVAEALELLAQLIGQTWLPRKFKKPLIQCDEDLERSQENLEAIDRDLNCSYAHQQFISAQCFVCSDVVVGLAQLLLASFIIGFLFIIILSLVLPILQRVPSSKHWKRRGILDLCRSDTPVGTPYQSISENDERTESVPLVYNAPRPLMYDSVYRSAEFHSFEDSWMPGLPSIPQPSNNVINGSPQYTSGEIRSMAF